MVFNKEVSHTFFRNQDLQQKIAAATCASLVPYIAGAVTFVGPLLRIECTNFSTGRLHQSVLYELLEVRVDAAASDLLLTFETHSEKVVEVNDFVDGHDFLSFDQTITAGFKISVGQDDEADDDDMDLLEFAEVVQESFRSTFLASSDVVADARTASLRVRPVDTVSLTCSIMNDTADHWQVRWVCRTTMPTVVLIPRQEAEQTRWMSVDEWLSWASELVVASSVGPDGCPATTPPTPDHAKWIGVCPAATFATPITWINAVAAHRRAPILHGHWSAYRHWRDNNNDNIDDGEQKEMVFQIACGTRYFDKILFLILAVEDPVRLFELAQMLFVDGDDITNFMRIAMQVMSYGDLQQLLTTLNTSPKAAAACQQAIIDELQQLLVCV